MGTLFDGIQASAFGQVLNLFGYDAIWHPASGGPTVSGRVLFASPTEMQTQATSTVEYEQDQWRMEYFMGTFPGLRELVDAATTIESVVIDDKVYHVRSAVLKFDGKTFECALNPAPDL